MSTYDYLDELKKMWEDAVEKYQGGLRGAENFFDKAAEDFIESIGATSQEIYDFAEDAVKYGEPDFVTFALLQDMRRAYFLEIQNGQRSKQILDISTIPAKEDAVDGVIWLPRILPKAKAKLRGELHPDIMYGCGGDRKFFRTNNIHAAEFLRMVWQYEDNDQAVIDWVKARRTLKAQAA